MSFFDNEDLIDRQERHILSLVAQLDAARAEADYFRGVASYLRGKLAQLTEK